MDGELPPFADLSLSCTAGLSVSANRFSSDRLYFLDPPSPTGGLGSSTLAAAGGLSSSAAAFLLLYKFIKENLEKKKKKKKKLRISHPNFN